MILKTYGMIWAAIAVIAGLLLLTGNLTAIAGIVLGFVCFGMVFMGMLMVLPATIAHHEPAAEKAAKINFRKEELAPSNILRAH